MARSGPAGQPQAKVVYGSTQHQVLVTALLLMPGETGELSIHYSDEMRPEVSWGPPGVLHGGSPPIESSPGDTSQSLISEEMIAQLMAGTK